MEDSEQDAGEGWGDDDDDDAQDLDVDTAWKVRKNTVRIIEAVFAACPETVRDQWISYLTLLTKRFIERVDHVKIDIIMAFQKVAKYA